MKNFGKILQDIFTYDETRTIVTGVKDKTITKASIPDSVKEVEWGVFNGCENLKRIIFTGRKEQWEKIKDLQRSGIK